MAVEAGFSAQEAALTPQRSPLPTEELTGLWHRGQGRLYLYVLGLVGDEQLAADVVQTAFARLLDHQGQLDARGLPAWLYKVAYHEALDQLRRGKRRRRLLEKNAECCLGGEQPEPERMALQTELVAKVQRALEQLPEPQRQVVEMRIYQNKTFALIAQELGVPLGTVLSRMHMAVRKLRRALRDWAPDHPCAEKE